MPSTPTKAPPLPAPTPDPPPAPPGRLLAVDLGLRTGFALFARSLSSPVRLQAYGSHHIGSRATLRRAAPAILGRFAPIDLLVVEGDAAMGRIWERAAAVTKASTTHVNTERWRRCLLLDREQRNGRDAKRHANTRALAVIEWSRDAGSDAPAVTGELRHDTAEAILIGLWGVLHHGLLRRDQAPWHLPAP